MIPQQEGESDTRAKWVTDIDSSRLFYSCSTTTRLHYKPTELLHAKISQIIFYCSTALIHIINFEYEVFFFTLLTKLMGMIRFCKFTDYLFPINLINENRNVGLPVFLMKNKIRILKIIINFNLYFSFISNKRKI